MNYFIADLHFGHENIIKFDNRPFDNVEEMDRALIDNWNRVVTDKDTVYILGDFCWGKKDDWIRYLKQLKGHKALIKGNHDLRQYPPEVRRYFDDIKDYKEFKFDGKTVIMSHYPIMCYKHSYSDNVYMLHGHTHNTLEQQDVDKWTDEMKKRKEHFVEAGIGSYCNSGNIINVGCMRHYMDYTPRTLDYLITAKEISKERMR